MLTIFIFSVHIKQRKIHGSQYPWRPSSPPILPSRRLFPQLVRARGFSSTWAGLFCWCVRLFASRRRKGGYLLERERKKKPLERKIHEYFCTRLHESEFEFEAESACPCPWWLLFESALRPNPAAQLKKKKSTHSSPIHEKKDKVKKKKKNLCAGDYIVWQQITLLRAANLRETCDQSCANFSAGRSCARISTQWHLFFSLKVWIRVLYKRVRTYAWKDGYLWVIYCQRVVMDSSLKKKWKCWIRNWCQIINCITICWILTRSRMIYFFILGNSFSRIYTCIFEALCDQRGFRSYLAL